MRQFTNNMEDNWIQYKDLVEKYLNILYKNPYLDDLKKNYEHKKVNRILENFTNPYKIWLNELIDSNILTRSIIENINNAFSNKLLITKFSKYIMSVYKNREDLLKITDNLDNIYDIVKRSIPKFKFSPTKLKFVTTTAIAWIVNPKDKIDINFKEIYNRFEIDKTGILLHKKGNIYRSKWVGKIVGCKTGGELIKGHFKKTNIGDFYNCTTVNVLLSPIKCANIKIFNNGKLQMTGIAKPADGILAVRYICELINSFTEKGFKIITNKENYKVAKFKYKTVMINTCYELGISVNREVLYNIISTMLYSIVYNI